MATKINKTRAFIKIKQITVSKEKAFVTFLVFANKAEEATMQRSLQFYIQDYNAEGEPSSQRLLSKNYYWLNYFNFGLTTDSNTVDLKLFKELTFEIDITKFNTSPIVDNRWLRTCRFRLQDNKTKEFLWSSEKINLISDEILVPNIEGVRIYSLDTDNETRSLEKIVVELKFKYESQYDFNYTNNNIEYVFQIASATTGKIIDVAVLKENSAIDENDELGYIKYTFEGKFNNTLNVRTAIRMVNGTIVKDKVTLYKPQKARNPIWIKKPDGGVEKVAATYNKKEGS
jgi:hypothetical protein